MRSGNSQEIARGAIEMAVGAVPVATFAAWLQFLQEINIILATVSLTFGVMVGAHGIYRIVRSYRRR